MQSYILFFHNKFSEVLGWRDCAGKDRRIVDDMPVAYKHHKKEKQPPLELDHRCQCVDVGSTNNED